MFAQSKISVIFVIENQLKMDKKKKHGGFRQGSGAKPKYGEKTKTVSYRVPLSKVNEFNIASKNLLKTYQK